MIPFSGISRCLILPFMLAVSAVASPLTAQTTTAILMGTVVDLTGAVLPGVSVQVKGPTIDRTVVTDATGSFRAVALPAGTYRVTATLSGFRTKILEGIELSLDRTVTFDVMMEVAGQAESVTVAVSVPVIDTTSSSMTRVIDSRTIDSIPLNGRNYLDLILLLPGVAVNDNARADLSARDTRGSILGERAGNTAFMIDGLENNDDVRGGVLQSFTQDAIQQFEVIEAGYKAEFGRGSGGIVNVVTKGGTNEVRGSGFFFGRHDALDASNVAGATPPKLARYNGGVTLGGPVKKDRSWYFGSIEYMAEEREAIFPPNVPDILRLGEDFSRPPETKHWRSFGKYDHRLNSRQDVRAEVSWTRLELLNELATAISLPSASKQSATNTALGTVALTSIIGPRFFLESSLGIRGQNFGQNADLAPERSFHITFVDDGSSFDFGPPIGSVQTLNQRYYTAREVANFFLRARHSGKLGVEYTRTVVDGLNGQGLQHAIVTTHPLFQLYGRESFQIPQGIAFLRPGDEVTRLRNHGVSLFGQDDWRLRNDLTVNLGVRYDYDSKFNVASNLAPRMGVVWHPAPKTAVRANWGLFFDRYRLGIAQPVPELGGFNGRTVVELDFPRLTADVLVPLAGSLGAAARTLGDPLFLNEAFGIPAGAVVTASNIQALTGLTPDRFLVALNEFLGRLPVRMLPVDFSPSTGYLRQNLSAAFQDEIRVSRPFKTPYNTTFTVGVQQVLWPGASASVSYIHRLIRNIAGVRIANLSPQSRVVGAPVTTDGGPLQRTYGPWYDGQYDGLIVAFEKRFGRRYQLQANYVSAKSTDNLLNANLGLGLAAQGGGAVPTDNLNLELDRGNSDLVVPQAFVVSGVVILPEGISLSGVFRATGGVYFSAAGTPVDYDGDGISSTRPRSTKRNEFRGPATANVDLRVEKRCTFGRYTASGLIEVFNLTNARNPRLIDNFFLAGAPGATFGAVRVPLPGRETQIGLRLSF